MRDEGRPAAGLAFDQVHLRPQHGRANRSPRSRAAQAFDTRAFDTRVISRAYRAEFGVASLDQPPRKHP